MSSQQQINELQKLQDLIEEKILHLRSAKVTETDAAIIFKIGSDIAKAQKERDKVAQEIAQLNQQKPISKIINNTNIKTILILAANPKNTSRLRLEEEIREIDEGLRRANKREQFKLEMKLAVRQRDFYRAILDTQPQIVHFCGHGGGEDGIVLEDETGQIAFVQADTLASLFKLFAKKNVECVVLNACYSEIQADAIHQHINYVIGMNRAIGDKAAINFSVAFYDALAAGEDVEFAFELGRSQLVGLKENQTPILKIKDTK
ncbi:CHAT domain-containing protein [Plectonema cf. radiosum LEGE 06105]|uniref:CHAT domain-containing protein n=1 Tax=Plectonema cf. radiosum LEGE 06105 TaxID=945769 RepID=A0A8J7EXH6_9CYAN|nr:CHAT domain-containing protein [Plectonema radiosum]MBE9211926.1 CHAT domain-containing protein [Plectonema cf. radiosum LEGE 06105]